MARLAVCINQTSQTFWMNSWRRRLACEVLVRWTVYTAAPVNKKDYSLSAGRHLLKFGKSYYKLDSKIESTNSGRVPYLDQKLKAQELRKHVLSFNSRPSPWWAAPRPCPLWKALPRPLLSRCFRSTVGHRWGPPTSTDFWMWGWQELKCKEQCLSRLWTVPVAPAWAAACNSRLKIYIIEQWTETSLSWHALIFLIAASCLACSCRVPYYPVFYSIWFLLQARAKRTSRLPRQGLAAPSFRGVTWLCLALPWCS
jgi:hypothetical protein